MKNKLLPIVYLFSAALVAVLLFSFDKEDRSEKDGLKFPYRQAGLTDRQAAAHLISRFTYGATPGQVDEVIKMGLEKWFLQQLDANQPDNNLQKMLQAYPSITLNADEKAETYGDFGRILKIAVERGDLHKDSVSQFGEENKIKYKDYVANYMQEKGLRPHTEIIKDMVAQKIVRAINSPNQLQEVLTSFWFNHFNVSTSKSAVTTYLSQYELQTIQPNILGKFETLLLATAQSPAMLMYLENQTSQAELTPQPNKDKAPQMIDGGMMDTMMAAPPKRGRGLNENYAREIMELHTLGVDGGYTQDDIIQAAKILTGWTIYPVEKLGGQKNAARTKLEEMQPERFNRLGFVHKGEFLFAANKHDKTAKTFLGQQFAPGGGIDEGLRLMHLLATHPSTASFISKKIATKFVNDAPAKSLIDKMSRTFKNKDGDIRQILLTMVAAPEFWDKNAFREKTKSPFELVASALRSVNATVQEPYVLFNWLSKMGERVYTYAAPTGFPDRGQYWINTGSLLSRMNFGLALASKKILGVKFDLLALNNHHEPESPEAALETYSRLLMPERDMTETIKRLKPLLNDPELIKKINAASAKQPVPNKPKADAMMDGGDELAANKVVPAANKMQPANNYMLAQVVGIIIGSPEFQRR